MDHRRIREACAVISECVRRGELTRQQGKTLIGQCKHGDVKGALKGLERLYNNGK